jgi:hypothetical protein
VDGDAITKVAGIINKNDFMEEGCRGSIYDAVDGAKQHRPRFIVEANHNTGFGEIVGIALLLASAME